MNIMLSHHVHRIEMIRSCLDVQQECERHQVEMEILEYLTKESVGSEHPLFHYVSGIHSKYIGRTNKARERLQSAGMNLRRGGSDED